MRSFAYVSAPDVGAAVRAISAEPGARFIGGGTNLVDLMRKGVEQPGTVIDVSGIGLTGVEELPSGGLRIGALARNSHVAAHPLVTSRFPLLSQAILNGASAQLRNMATVGGNLLQRTRCLYFNDIASACNKRVPGSGCAAADGFNRDHAVLGTSEHCTATHPSDMCVALAALDAVVEVQSVRGTRRIPLTGFHLLPGDTPHRETALAADELVTAVELPPLPRTAVSRYRKVRDRASYAFALVSVAAVVQARDGVLTDVRLALGGVGTKPWRAHEAERVLRGAPATVDSLRQAAEAELAAATPRSQNAFKVELARRTVMATLAGLLAGEQGDD